MFEKRRARREAQQRHHRLMRAALDLVGLLGRAPADQDEPDPAPAAG